MDEALDKMFIKMRKAGRDLVRALTDSMQGEEAFLESMVEYEKTTAKEDGEEISDEQLENGEVDIESKKSSVRIGYFAYLVMAEIQERIISACNH